MYEKIKSWISKTRFLVGMGVGAVLFLACYLFIRVGIHDNGKRAVTLEQNSNRQLAISSQLAVELQTAREQLIVSDQELTEAKLQKELLQKQLTDVLNSSKKQENLQKEILKSLPPSAPGVLREIGAKIGIDHYVTGISYGVSRRIGSKYIGLRGEYDWQDKKAGVWVTYAY